MPARNSPEHPVGWKSYLLWEAMPLLTLFVTWGVLTAINWRYECKLFVAGSGASAWAGIPFGLVFLAIALGMALLAGYMLARLRTTQSLPANPWVTLFKISFIAIFLIFPSLFVIVLGPAVIEMLDTAR